MPHQAQRWDVDNRSPTASIPYLSPLLVLCSRGKLPFTKPRTSSSLFLKRGQSVVYENDPGRYKGSGCNVRLSDMEARKDRDSRRRLRLWFGNSQVQNGKKRLRKNSFGN